VLGITCQEKHAFLFVTTISFHISDYSIFFISNMARYVMTKTLEKSHYLDSSYTIRQRTIVDVEYINIHLHDANGLCSLLRSLSFWRLCLENNLLSFGGNMQ